MHWHGGAWYDKYVRDAGYDRAGYDDRFGKGMTAALLFGFRMMPPPAAGRYLEEAAALRSAIASRRDRAVDLAARRITTAWRRCVSCPDYLVCRRRLLSEAAELMAETGA
jgi:hypothetical protein